MMSVIIRSFISNEQSLTFYSTIASTDSTNDPSDETQIHLHLVELMYSCTTSN